MKKTVYFLALAFLALVACKGNENKEASSTGDSTATVAAAPPDTTKHSAAQYTCPMHPEINSDTMGQCPKCGMDLEVKS